MKDELRRLIAEAGGTTELAASLERRYAIRIEDHELENLASVERLARFVAAKVFEEDQHAA